MTLKSLHIFLALFSFCSFAARIAVSEYRPEKLRGKWPKIVPLLIDSALLASGIALAVQGGWFSPVAPWLSAKLIALAGYIGLGIVAMRQRGRKRWPAFAASACCYGYILAAAISKSALLFV
jgi:uncharacterized membrane protein SirB2